MMEFRSTHRLNKLNAGANWPQVRVSTKDICPPNATFDATSQTGRIQFTVWPFLEAYAGSTTTAAPRNPPLRKPNLQIGLIFQRQDGAGEGGQFFLLHHPIDALIVGAKGAGDIRRGEEARHGLRHGG